jgi:hypothetical protein
MVEQHVGGADGGGDALDGGDDGGFVRNIGYSEAGAGFGGQGLAGGGIAVDDGDGCSRRRRR